LKFKTITEIFKIMFLIYLFDEITGVKSSCMLWYAMEKLLL